VGGLSEVKVLFLTPWFALSGDRAKFFETELARELAPHHALYTKRRTAVAITGASDDVLYRLDDGKYAQVHLTHTRTAPETVPGVPPTGIFETLADWMIDKMLPDHVEHFGLWPEGW
jgi:hypothetical protein